MKFNIRSFNYYFFLAISSIIFTINLNTTLLIKERLFFLFIDDNFLYLIFFIILIFSNFKKFILFLKKITIWDYIFLGISAIYILNSYQLIFLFKIIIFIYSFKFILSNPDIIFDDSESFYDFLKLFLKIVIGIIVLTTIIEIFLFLYGEKYLFDLIWSKQDLITLRTYELLNNNIDLHKDKTQLMFEGNRYQWFLEKFRLHLFLTNPILILLNLFLINIVVFSLDLKNKFEIIITLLLLVIAFLTLSRFFYIYLFNIVIYFFIKNKNVFKIKFLILLLVFVGIFSLFLLLRNKIGFYEIIYSRFKFYIQFLEQINYDNILRIDLKNYPKFYELNGRLTGPHSDILFLISYFGLLYLISFVAVIYKYFNFKIFSLFIIIFIILNGLIELSSFWIFMIIYTLHASIYNNSNEK